ncbi:hypothetical protein YC2023_038179 [Brassica napus]
MFGPLRVVSATNNEDNSRWWKQNAPKACNDSSDNVNWDGVHYTQAANRFVAQHNLSGRYYETASAWNP